LKCLIKKCLNCGLKTAHKDGKQSGLQRYRCKSCGYRFQNKNKQKELQKKIWDLYVNGKQTYKQIAKKHGKSAKWVQKIIDDYFPPLIFVEPQKIYLVIDTFYISFPK